MKTTKCGTLDVAFCKTNPARIQPVPEPEQPDNLGPWTTIACELCGVVAALGSLGMMYLVSMCGMGRW